MTTDDFLAAVEAAPADPGPKLVLADWLDEHGHSKDAYALRWMAARNKHPRRLASGLWKWRMVHTTAAAKKPHNLCGILFSRPIRRLLESGGTFGQCIRILGAVLKLYRSEVALEPDE